MNQDAMPQFERTWLLFEEALETPAGQRAEFLRIACGDDEVLRARVQSLLDANTAGFLRTGGAQLVAGDVVQAYAADLVDTLGPGSLVGDYRLIEEVGAGGMSRVYLAQREGVDFEQKVALKLMRSFSTARAESHSRFEREQQVLASLSHPNIAGIIDGGVTASHRPYLVMEFVDGEPITDYCRRNAVDLNGRLDLFIDVCAAVEHAHRRLIVHRDIKPSNIMVTRDGHVKLLDFGIAKLLDAADSGDATKTGLLMLTPQYAAPEQVTGGVVTTATDLYALSLILFELLTGSRPWEIQDGSVTEQLRHICSQPPPKPSTVATKNGNDGPATHWSHRLRGDLDLIVAKGLAKDPQERYGVCGELIGDLDNWRQGKPVSAHAPRVSYVARKYIRRHWIGLSTAAVAAGVVGFFIVALIQQQGETRRERDRAQFAEAATGAVNRFLIDELLGAASPESASGRDIPVSEVLDRAAITAGRAFKDQPLLEASVRDTLGRTYLRLGDLDKASSNIDRARDYLNSALPVDHPDRLRTGTSQASLELAQGKYAEALSSVTTTLERQQNSLGTEHVDTLVSRALLGMVQHQLDQLTAAETNLKAAIDRLEQHYPNVWRPRTQALLSLVKVNLSQRQPNAARQVAERLLRLQQQFLGQRHPDVVETMMVQSEVLSQLLLTDEALAKASEALTLARSMFGDNHPAVAPMMSQVGKLYFRARRYAEAAEVDSDALAGYTRLHGAEHPQVVNARHNLAVTLAYLGRYVEAEEYYVQNAEYYESHYGSRDTRTIRTLKSLTNVLRYQNKDAESRKVVERLVAIARSFVDAVDEDPILINDMADYLLVCEPRDLRDPETALHLATTAVERTERERGTPLMTLGLALRAQGKLSEAIATYEEAAVLADVLHWHSLPRDLAALYLETGDIDGGIAFFEAHLARRREARSADDWLIGMTLHEFGRFFVNAGVGERAVPLLHQAIEQYRLTRPADDILVYRSRAALGAAQAQMGQFDDAENNLLEGFRGLKSDRQTTSEVKREILAWLVNLYESREQIEQANQWSTELSARAGEPQFSVW